LYDIRGLTFHLVPLTEQLINTIINNLSSKKKGMYQNYYKWRHH